MAYWMTSTQMAEKYEVTEQEILSWTELKDISSAYINDNLMIDDDSVQFYLETNKMLAEKQAIRERLVREEDKIIQQELKKYDDAALFIRLQSECFPLYDLLIKVLAAMIPNIQDRKLFCAITQGHSLKHIPKYHKMGDEDTFKVYLELVRKLHADVKYILIVQKQTNKTLDKFLKDEKDQEAKLKQENNDWKAKYEQLNIELDHRNKEKKAWILSKYRLRKEIFELQKEVLQLRKIFYDINHILNSTEEKAEECTLTSTKQEEDRPFYLAAADRITDFLCRIKDITICKRH